MFFKMLLVGRLTSDSISQLVGRIAFDRLWVGLLKYIQFKRGRLGGV